jgi:hypothetical protein
MNEKDLMAFLDYSRIYSDLALKPPFNSKMIVVSPVNLGNIDIYDREGMDLIMEKVCSKHIFFVEKIPISTDTLFELPICVAVPNPRA